MKTSSVLLFLALSAAGAAELAVSAPGGEFLFSDVAVWKYVKARDEKIPALRATLDNRTGKDWTTASFLVRAACPDGERTYPVRLHNLHTGSQTVAETAFDAIGVVHSCEESSVTIEFREGVPAEPPTYVVLGFAWDAEGQWSTALEAIMEHRRPTQFRAFTRRVTWREGGALLLERGGPQPVAFYAFRVEPGEFGLAGFSISPSPDDTGPLNRFLRFYLLPMGKASYLGVFRAFKGSGSEVGVRFELDRDTFEELRSRAGGVLGRELVLVDARKPLNYSTSTRER